MTISQEFAYHKPRTLEEALELLTRLGPGAQILAGGTDLVGWLRDDLISPEALIDLKGIAGLDGVAVQGDSLEIGALVTFNQLLETPAVVSQWPLLSEMAQVVASYGIRNRATVVGNLCSAVACCDAGPALLVYEASMRLVGSEGRRSVPLSQWFVGNRKTLRRPNEIVTGISIPRSISQAGARREDKSGGAFVKLRRYQGEDLAQVSVAVLVDASLRYRVALGAVAPTPVRALAIEAVLEGQELSAEVLALVTELLPQQAAPISDLRASREYRELMLKVMLERGLVAANSRLQGRGPSYGTELV